MTIEHVKSRIELSTINKPVGAGLVLAPGRGPLPRVATTPDKMMDEKLVRKRSAHKFG